MSTPPSVIAGPVKWAAVGALSMAAVMGLAWSLTTRQPRGLPPLMQVQTVPAPTAKKAEPPPSIATLQAPAPADVPGAPPAPAEESPAPAADTAPSMPDSPPAKPAMTARTRINVNTATAVQLELLPQIGPALAKRIIDYRQAHGRFKSLADLDKVRGIGEKTLAKISPLISFD